MDVQSFLEFHLDMMVRCFNLTHFELTIVRKNSLLATMDIDIDTQYLYGEIRYGKTIVKAYNKGEEDFVLQSLAHEVTHCLTAQLSCFYKTTKLRLKTEEQVTEHISRLLFQYYKRYLKEINNERL